MVKKLIAFDLDDTLAVTKSPIEPSMAKLLGLLAAYYDICVITGGRYEQIESCVLKQLEMADVPLAHFHLMPLSGAHHHFRTSDNSWQHVRYIPDLNSAEKERIITAMQGAASDLGYWEKAPAGNIIEDRHSQITFSALGQQAAPADKYAWDPDYTKRKKLRTEVADRLPDFEVRINGNTSIDVTRQEMDKGYGMKKLLEALSLSTGEVLFIGDQLYETGNDYPIKLLGIDTISVSNSEHTRFVIEGILGVSSHRTKRSV